MPIIINRRREPPDNMEKEKIIIGKIVNAVGLKGEVRIYSYSDRKERFGELESFILSGKDGDVRCKVEKVRYQKNMVIAKLAGIDDLSLIHILRAVLLTSAIAAFAFVASLVGDGIAYTVAYSLCGIAGVYNWLTISVSHYRFRHGWLAKGHTLAVYKRKKSRTI